MRSLTSILFLAALAMMVQPLTGCSDDTDDSKTNNSADADASGDDATGDDATGDDASGEDVTGEDATGEDATGEDATGEDATGEDATGEDATGDDATGDDASGDDASESGLSQTCEGECLVQSVTLEYGGETGATTYAVFGLNGPAITDSGEWEVRIETWEGEFAACPVQDSPTPEWQFVITGFELPQDETPLTKADDNVFLTLLDFNGQFLGFGPPGRATEVTLTPVAMRIDTDLVAAGQQDEDGFIAMDISAAFGTDGQTSGHLYARHCASMDLLE